MKIITHFVLALALALLTLPSMAQTYAIGSVQCSRGLTPVYCYGVPATRAGQSDASFWIDTYPDTAHTSPYFIQWFNGLSNLGTSTVNRDASLHPEYGPVSYTTPDGKHWTASQLTVLSLTYYGTTSTGNGYNGSMSISFAYTYVDVCSGRGCSTGWKRKVTGGSTTFAVADY